MKTSLIKAVGQARWCEEETPTAAGDQVVVRVEAVGLCGTDIHRAQYAPDWERWGHEFAGVVEEVGPQVRRLQPGDTVVWVPVLPCGECRRCLAGNPLMCLRLRGTPGRGAAEQVCDAEEFWLPYRDLTPLQAAMAEPLTVAIDLAEEGGVGLGDVVVVLGGGPIGLMAARVCQLRGAREVLVTELAASTAKIELARAWGLHVIEADRHDVPAAVRRRAPDGADVVLVTAPPPTLPLALQCCAFGATVALIGVGYAGAEQVTIDVNHFHFRNIRIQGAHNCPVLRFPLAFDLMRRRALDAEALATHDLPLARLQDALDLVKARPGEYVKIMLRP